ncbi:hypothetical protein J5N97_011604 [Dioscorea zingiberensis]|uniref:Gnk2-homologous domain-containing protein n=1 Tax=Dioscorea zingiberensis TaxID=325984 RepID=A0A9D5D2G6_9LILI|nr:hypothetical protein J5N97_011604 [Dioscorea zingiberensis]
MPTWPELLDLTRQDSHQLCAYNKVAIIYYDNCFLRYSNQDFLNYTDNSDVFYIRNAQNTTEWDPFNKILRSKQLSPTILGRKKMYALGMRNIFMVPLLTIFLLHLFLAEAYLSQINPSNLECDYSSNYTIPSPYKTNLDTLLSNLTATAPYSDALFYNNSVVKDSDAAYGLAQCRPNTSPDDCAVCLYRSALSFSSNCLFARSAAVWFDNCFFRYSDHRFFSQLDDKVLAIAVNAGNISNPMVFSQPLKELMYEVTSKAQRNETRFASASFNYSMFGNIYGIAECTRDLTDVDCSTCLNQSLPLLLQQANSGRPGCRVISFSCSLRFELYPILPPPLPPPPKSPNPTDNGK